ncbi:MAG: pyridoxamine 5'-phosphate oxidase family protein [Desulfobacteraceae bacterium]|nr:pyridoxamine 5'-phosphate oxidase family protein [Desulfobacteraceae bacterium]
MEALKDYFENTRGMGVMATADKEGKVNAAIYSRPHFLEDGSIAFIMRDRLTHHNLQSNLYAAYLFVEEGPGYKGKRLHLRKIREEENSELIQSLSRREYENEKPGSRFLVAFQVDKVLPLIGAGDEQEA